MTRARIVLAATLVGATLAGAIALAQTPPKFEPILAGKEFTPPVRGAVEIEYTNPTRKRSKDLIVSTIQVKNISSGPIARLTIEEIWYDKGGAVIGGGKGVINGLLPAGDVQTITIETPFNPQFNSNNYRFSHANGSVTPNRVDKIEDPDAAAAAKK
jgi:hypothetical protein